MTDLFRLVDLIDPDKPIPVAMQRVMDEVRAQKVPDGGRYNRTYHRHNRS